MDFKFLKLKNKNIPKANEDHFQFVDLSPVDCADSDGTYTAALNFAMENIKVKNIALTGPYGAGKTSVIKTFEKNTNYNFLNISLAAFANPKSEDGGATDINEAQGHAIERSILQQMIYGVPAKKIPYSRFKRISPLSFTKTKALTFIACIAISINEYFNKSLITTIQNKDYLNPWVISSGLFLSIILYFLFITSYKAKHSYSIRKLSLQGEIELDDTSSDSILNRHLDEIIYFFDETDYDMVVIEDLDRFGSTDIFIKLREINKLINDQKKYKSSKPIKFIYAIKDDMFTNKERAKFFDFIIPVIPIINSSNSYEKITERLKKYRFHGEIDPQFLKEIALYIDDLRLIHNIINELIIYEKKLTSSKLNFTKLISVIIYKNVYPNDFEMLHNSSGAFFEILKSRDAITKEIHNDIDKEINSIMEKIESSRKEPMQSIEDLIKIFLYEICKERQANGIYIGGDLVNFEEIQKWENFSRLFELNEINVSAYLPHYNSWRKQSLGKSFSQIEKEALKGEKFSQRKQDIDNRISKKNHTLNIRLNTLRKEKLDVKKLRLCELIKRHEKPVDAFLEKKGIYNSNLLAFLINNGYLDETYYHYTSNFHEGRLSKNDRDYILSIRDLRTPDPTQRIDTPKEVCREMRESDFEQAYSLNVNLIDYILSTNEEAPQKINSIVDFIAKNPEKTKSFFESYWAEGKNLSLLTNAISRRWKDYAYEVIYHGYSIDHVTCILAYVDSDFIFKEMNNDKILTEYISDNAGEVFSSTVSIIENFEFIKKLDVKIKNLREIENNNDLLFFLHDNNCYQINLENINTILSHYKNDSGKAIYNETFSNYTTIREYGSKELNDYISKNISQYINSVFLALEDNSNENEEYIKTLINSKDLNIDQKTSILDTQTIIFADFNEIPEYLWEHLLESNKIALNWKNISACLSSEECDNNAITELLNSNRIFGPLTESKIIEPDLGKERCQNLSRFILSNNAINENNYEALILCLSYHYNNFPKVLSNEKMIALAEAKIVILNRESFDFSNEKNELLIALIKKNITEYFSNIHHYPIDDHVREALVFSDIGKSEKIELVKEIGNTKIKESKRLSEYIIDLIINSDMSEDFFNHEIIIHFIENSGSIEKSILLLSMFMPFMKKEDVMHILKSLPTPYCDIATYGKRPKLEKTEENTALAKQLKKFEIVASVNEEDIYLRINTFKTSKED